MAVLHFIQRTVHTPRGLQYIHPGPRNTNIPVQDTPSLERDSCTRGDRMWLGISNSTNVFRALKSNVDYLEMRITLVSHLR